MANIKDNLSKYGVAFIGFDESSGNAMDSIGGQIGTLYNAPARVAGWNGKDSAMSFNGTNQYVAFNSSIIPIGEKTIRFKIFVNAISSSGTSTVISNGAWSSKKGFTVSVTTGNVLNLYLFKGVSGVYVVHLQSTITLGEWHDVLYTQTSANLASLYINGVLVDSQQLTDTEHIGDSNLFLGRAPLDTANYFNGRLDSIEIYNKVISDTPDKYFVYHGSQYKYHDGTAWQTVATNSVANFIKYGMNNLDHITEAQWKELVGNKSVVMWSDFEDKQNGSVILNRDTYTAQDLMGDTPQVIYYTESNVSQAVIETGVEPFSLYDYIGELPSVVAYTEDTEDIVVTTKTENFDVYDELSDSVEVLYYTDTKNVEKAYMNLKANYTPIDELDGDFEVISWTDEAPETAQRVLEMKATPKPQFIKLVNPKRVYGALDDVFANDISQSYRDEARYLVCGEDTTKWQVWDKKQGRFVIVDASTHEAILANGMRYSDLNNITETQWRTWKGEYVNIGIFLKDNPRDTITSIVGVVSYEDYLPRNTSTISDTSLYILNTTAKIDISFNGNVLKGVLADDDLTRVQYRVLLNGGYFYPSDGSFTKLGESPQNIELAIGSKDIKIDDWNTLRVEFQDFFGTTDYWSTQFMGTYSGLMFKDVYGQYYSSEIGEVLQYLDFGIIIAGQTTIEHEVVLKNQYGYDVKNVHLYANTANFPSGMSIEFSQSLSPFTPQPELRLSGTLKNNEEMSFFIRLKTELGSTPDANGSFDIIVRADKA